MEGEEDEEHSPLEGGEGIGPLGTEAMFEMHDFMFEGNDEKGNGKKEGVSGGTQ